MLAQLLSPDWTAGTTLAHLPLQPLLERPEGPIRALVLDVDRTLLPRRQTVVPAPALRWLEEAKQAFPIHLLSNNPSRQRIGSVAETLDLPYTDRKSTRLNSSHSSVSRMPSSA